MKRLLLGALAATFLLSACSSPLANSEEEFPNAERVASETRSAVSRVVDAAQSYESERTRLLQQTAQENWTYTDLGNRWGGRWDMTSGLVDPLSPHWVDLSQAVDEWQAWEDNVAWPDTPTDGVPSHLSVMTFSDTLDEGTASALRMSEGLDAFHCDPNQNEESPLSKTSTPQWSDIEGCWQATLANGYDVEPIDRLIRAAEQVLAETD